MMSLRSRPGQLNQSVFPLHQSRFLRRWIEEQISMSGLPGIREQMMARAFSVPIPLSLAANFLFAPHSGAMGLSKAQALLGRGRPDRLPSYGQCPHWGSLFCGHLANAVSYQ